MQSYLKIIQGSKIYYEKPSQLRLFPSEYNNDERWHLPIFVEGPANQGIFKTEVGRVVLRGSMQDIIFQTWKLGNRTMNIDSVWLDLDNGCAHDHLASNRFAIAVVDAIMAYSVGIQERLNIRGDLGSKAVLLGYICDHQWLEKLYRDIAHK